MDELIRVISNSNIPISVDEIEALVGESAESKIEAEPEPCKHPPGDLEGITRQTTFSYPPLDPVSVRPGLVITLY